MCFEPPLFGVQIPSNKPQNELHSCSGYSTTCIKSAPPTSLPASLPHMYSNLKFKKLTLLTPLFDKMNLTENIFLTIQFFLTDQHSTEGCTLFGK